MPFGLQRASVLVHGDFVYDHHIYEGRRHDYSDGSSRGVHVKRELGGAALVHDLLRALFEHAAPDVKPRWRSMLGIEESSENSTRSWSDTRDQAYAFWRPHPADESRDKQVWHVREAMGFGHFDPDEKVDADKRWITRPVPDGDDSPEILVLSEGGMDFRDNSDCWKHLPFETAKWIVLKSVAPLAAGELWEALSEHRERLIVILSADQLRQSASWIPADLSWEATLDGLLCGLRPGGALADLRECRHLVVSFESEGAVWLDLDKHSWHLHLVYNPASIEPVRERQAPVSAFGFLSCLTASIVWHLARGVCEAENTDDASAFAAFDRHAALEAGLSAMKDLDERGHGPVTSHEFGFPRTRLAGVIRRPNRCFTRSELIVDSATPDTLASPGERSLLAEAQRLVRTSTEELARLVALRGPIALGNVPHLRVGRLFSAERREIESLRTLARSIRHYEKHATGKVPLSVGVFGPPGAGKSFAVEELAHELVENSDWLEFNLSQFDSPKELIGAFHQIRDKVLQGKLPVAFFDEFDSQGYRWLQYLLAPMQDGRFQEGQLTHALGKCIFVCAGGTSWTFDTFGPPSSTEAKDAGTSSGSRPDDEAKFRLAKGPDFRSRLDAYLDITGPNRRSISPPPTGATILDRVSGHLMAEDADDDMYLIRRALMIRSTLKCKPHEKLGIDEGLLEGLLLAKRYTHGARSLRKILNPLVNLRPSAIHRSSLAPPKELTMHIGEEDARRLTKSPPPERYSPKPLSKDDVETIASEIHETWRRLGKHEGWLEEEKDKSFHELDAGSFEIESNYAAARRIPAVLALVGLRLDDGSEPSSTDEPIEVRRHLEFHLELLADAEHAGWMQWHLDRGWRYAATTKPEDQLHSCLRPYAELSEMEKSKDRTAIRSYPHFARKADKHVRFITS